MCRTLLDLFEEADRDLAERKSQSDRRMEQLRRVKAESVANQETRFWMGRLAHESEQEKAGALPELSAFGRQIVAVTGYLCEDLRRLARDMVSAAGGRYEADRENLVPALEARMRSAWGDELPPGFLAALADGWESRSPRGTALRGPPTPSTGRSDQRAAGSAPPPDSLQPAS